MTKLLITPKTKIYDLLKEYPDLEDRLTEMSPEFKKLANPVLRKTITRITNLNQAAVIAGLNVETVVNILRREAGQEEMASSPDTGSSYNTERQKWVDENILVDTIDIRNMLHEGEQPVHEVLASLNKLKDGEVLKVIAPFVPAPLLDKSIGLGYKHWLHQQSEEEYWIYLSK